jgi:F-type H+-transporting ATPase subunit gamma
MQTLDALKRKIDTADDLRTIVRTMKALAAVSMRQYERAVASLAEYTRTMDLGMQAVLRLEGAPFPPQPAVAENRLGTIVFGSDHGLCGRFNDQAVATALSTMQELAPEPGQRNVFAVGTRAAAGLEEAGQPVQDAMPMPASLAGITPMVQTLLMRLDTWRQQQRLGRIVLFHNRLLSGTAYSPQMVPLLPIDLTRFQRPLAPPWPSRSLPLHTMERGRLLASLLRQRLFVALYRAFAESLASENASRLASMQAAERNIEERLEELQALFRYRRQHSITEELLDIVAGFEALSETDANLFAGPVHRRATQTEHGA